MKKIILLNVFVTALWSCNGNGENKTNASYDSLATNPHAVPSHVDTITHEDGLSNQSQVNSDTTTSKDTVTKNRNDTLPSK